TASASAPVGIVSPATDASYYFGALLEIELAKLTNGEEADAAPGPLILAGQPVTWTYIVTNSSNVPLTNVLVADDQGLTVSCPSSVLESGSQMTCEAFGTSVSGQYSNTGTVTASPPGLPSIMASDTSHYFGFHPEISLEKRTNDQDADSAPGPYIDVGSPVTWTYQVTNSGNISLSNIVLSDDKIGSIRCPKSELDVAESMICIETGIAGAGQYANSSTVTGTTSLGNSAAASDMSHYFGMIAALEVEKLTNGEDADLPPGPSITEGDPILWEFIVTNSGNVQLVDVTVNDDAEGEVSCPSSRLDPGEAMTCTHSGIAVVGAYTNEGTASGRLPTGVTIQASDLSHYFGVDRQYYTYIPLLND
ncbi:MAG: hypothetical protein ACK2T3_17260, partial [Candidatus Promineifilaceae bacterium]